jgi:hypothetical protein
MRRRTIALSILLACGLAGCGGPDTVATVPIVDTPIVEAAPAPETTTAPTTAVPTTEAPPPTAAPTTAAPRVLPTTPTTEPEPELEPEPEPVHAVVAEPTGACDPSYPGVCIPPGPPDLDCADIPFRRFTVVGADPHRFDGNDDDGIGCESG